MVSPNDRLIIWTSSVAKAKMRKSRQYLKVSARMRMDSWKKQRQQILDWVGTSLSDLQLLPEDVRQQTDVLMEAALFAVDSSGALSVGLWPALPGLWAERKGAEFDKFAQVETWVEALLQLTAPVLGTGAVIFVAGGTASGVAGAGVPSGTAGATTGLGTGTAATVFSAPAAAVDPDAIAAAIATALGGRLDALGSRIAHLEARGAAPAGASLLSGGVAPPEAELLARALRDSVATVESWDVARCSLACADLVHEAAKLRPQLTLLKEMHPFGKLPMKALEANAFPMMVYALPELAAEECELDELPAGKEATQEHWRAFVHLLKACVGEFQHFVKSKVPSFPMTDVMVASFFKKRKRVQFDGDEEDARAAGGGSALLPPLDAAHREQLAALGSSFRTINEDQLARALRGEVAPEDIVRPPGEVPVVIPGPVVEVDMAPVAETEIEGEATLVEHARVELEGEVPAGGLASERCRAIPTLTSRAHLVVAAFQDWHDVDFLVRIELDKDEFTTVKEAYGKVVRQYNGKRVVLERRLVDERHFATDASGTLGFGGWSINYLELFAVWWAVVLWGHKMSGRTVVVNIDNQSAMYQVGNWWGPVAYLPLLRQIFFVCAKHDIRLQPKYINTKDNLLADLLSRLDMPRTACGASGYRAGGARARGPP
ncbi:hypothetical protein CYMTET_30167 [Cymbomonas tetramitiformis]|uniref:Uncharacterized protein n=1 Tax=Cymbomonas tetramitiformis TaxID=36881 RepID=A0AAE0KUF0_9CHLO|nr:hypothetical protein CYMTET_30167 [Cymbomonas tetramitiformis]